ncbi:MAG UNVERIFIED_CONTAM: hypothetical protein LVR29_33775 [Microcystis novacekii LVE1205-3]|jgi:UDP-N-acetylmuramyl pentapeptide phosphotransferase/UDP-N-acetylglucosamine-1-phosphate transferase
MDGLDGLVAGCTAVQLGFLALYFQQPILWLLVAALVGFLLWNWSPAKIFMGDVGSTSLGAIVAMVLLNTQGNQGQAWSALTITFPLIGDAIYTLICRLLKKGKYLPSSPQSPLSKITKIWLVSFTSSNYLYGCNSPDCY